MYNLSLEAEIIIGFLVSLQLQHHVFYFMINAIADLLSGN